MLDDYERKLAAKSRRAELLWMVVVVAAMTVAILAATTPFLWLEVRLYDECRAHGFSVLYCL